MERQKAERERVARRKKGSFLYAMTQHQVSSLCVGNNQEKEGKGIEGDLLAESKGPRKTQE